MPSAQTPQVHTPSRLGAPQYVAGQGSHPQSSFHFSSCAPSGNHMLSSSPLRNLHITHLVDFLFLLVLLLCELWHRKLLAARVPRNLHLGLVFFPFLVCFVLFFQWDSFLSLHPKWGSVFGELVDTNHQVHQVIQSVSAFRPQSPQTGGPLPPSSAGQGSKVKAEADLWSAVHCSHTVEWGRGAEASVTRHWSHSWGLHSHALTILTCPPYTITLGTRIQHVDFEGT